MVAAVWFAAAATAFALLVASGQRGGDTFFSNPILTVPFLTAVAAGVSACAYGATAIVRDGERSVAVVAVTMLGLFVTAFAVLELAFPH